jgi:dynein heavy chain, axonemal
LPQSEKYLEAYKIMQVNSMIYCIRILQVLTSMRKVTLHALPESDQPWTIEEFIEKNEEICRMAAIDLHRKSTMIEEAVEEVLQLVRKATDSFKSTTNSNQFDFLTTEGNKSMLIF